MHINFILFQIRSVTQLKVPKTLIFVNEKRRCDMVAIYLAIKDFRVMSINAYVFFSTHFRLTK